MVGYNKRCCNKVRELVTIGISRDDATIEKLVTQGREWIDLEEQRCHPRLELFGKECKAREDKLTIVEQVLSNVSNIFINGTDLILDLVFFNRIEDEVFCKLVKSRLAHHSSMAEYLKSHFDDDVSLSKIYRYLDRLSNHRHELVQDISVRHTIGILGGQIGVLFYDVTTLCFEADREDDLRRTGLSKEGRHSNQQIILGLLVSLDGYPPAYCIHEDNKCEGHTMLPTIKEFVQKYNLEDFIIVADSGLMNNTNIEEFETLGYKYIIGAKIKNESAEVRRWILEQLKEGCRMVAYEKGGGRRLLVGYADDRAKKEAYNRDKGIRHFEKAYKSNRLTKANINKRGYNKFLTMKGNVEVSINYDKFEEDARWDGLKVYLTNTDIPTEQVYVACHNLWNLENAFRIAKSKIEIRLMFHFTRKRIETHICICFVALKVHKELYRILKASDIKLSVDNTLALAQTVTTIQILMPRNKSVYPKTMLMAKYQKTAKLFDDEFWGTQ
ncbi:MAG: IS1634 family transposase [Paraprevotella sp.]|nr:IS1634 family transposase [Paraprevotella sp.]